MNNAHWTAEQVPDLTGKTVLITGANSGIGFDAARVLARKGAAVTIAVRDIGKGADARARIVGEDTNADVAVMRLDLASLASVHEFAGAFRAAHPRLDLLINNAGVMVPPYAKTADGFELQFGTNHLGHFALTGRLLDLILPTKGARVVNVTSSAHKMGKLDFEDLDWTKRKYSPWRAYGDSKIANIYFTDELDRRFKAVGVDVLSASAHPGLAVTDLKRTAGMLVSAMVRVFGQNSAMGALPTLRAAVDPRTKGGEYYGPDGFQTMSGYPIVNKKSALAQNKDIARRLWDVSEKLTGVKFSFTA